MLLEYSLLIYKLIKSIVDRTFESADVIGNKKD
jgi:hypothetical protein